MPLLQGLTLKGKRHALPIDAARYWKHNRIVWVGPARIPVELTELASSLRTLLTKEKLKTEERPFAAHITLIRKARVPETIPVLPKIEWPVNEVVLVRSRLSSTGSSYEVAQRYPLR